MPVFNESKRSEELSDLIKNEINQKGVISFEQFMSLALYQPRLGYYCADSFQLGEKGDFTTAPEISPLFARCIAKQYQQIAGFIPDADILELGAGSGRFAADMLIELEKFDCLPSRYYIYEISLSLRQQQQAFIQAHYPHYFPLFCWLDTLDKIPLNPPFSPKFKGMIFANEVLDALPFHCFQLEHHQVKERGVTWDGKQFAWQLIEPNNELSTKALQLQNTYHLPPGYQSEINLHLTDFIYSLTQVLAQGVILFADYGYGQREYYHPQRNQGTLTCFYRHHRHNHPLLHPGLQDITAHVDFTRVIDIASTEGMTLLGYTNQASFLLACGLLELATTLEEQLNEVERFKLHQAIKQLTMPTEMGERIKIMGLGKNIVLPPLLGFSLQDRRRDL